MLTTIDQTATLLPCIESASNRAWGRAEETILMEIAEPIVLLGGVHDNTAGLILPLSIINRMKFLSATTTHRGHRSFTFRFWNINVRIVSISCACVSCTSHALLADLADESYLPSSCRREVIRSTMSSTCECNMQACMCSCPPWAKQLVQIAIARAYACLHVLLTSPGGGSHTRLADV